jgi:cell division septation protein DedD
MPKPDVGNPAWALAKADAAYTLQVAAFEPTDRFQEFKQAAADYCAMLREQGFEAYYHHTDAVSMVTVGLFGPAAVRVGPNGRSYYSREVIDLQQSDELLKYNRVNGGIYKVKNDEGIMVPVPSRLVKTPKAEDSTPW